jgi:hypothetical protein
MYELANTYVASGKQDLALKTFDRLISEFKNGSYCKINFASRLIYYNSDRNADALTKFKKSSV